jgi:site-specific recombinase XerD
MVHIQTMEEESGSLGGRGNLPLLPLRNIDEEIKGVNGRRNKDILTHEEVERIIQEAAGVNRCVYALMLTLYHCALRKCEVITLDVDDVRFDSCELFLRGTKTRDMIVYMEGSVSDAIKEYCLYERKPHCRNEKALFLNAYDHRIGEHFIRGHFKKCAVGAGIVFRVYPHLLRASSITHLLNRGVNPFTFQCHARHRNFRTTMIYSRPTQQQMRNDIERAFVGENGLSDKDRVESIVDRYLRGELSNDEMGHLPEVMRPKQLNYESEFTGYA